MTAPLNQLLLLVQNQADVDALPVAATAYVAHGYNALWLLFSPAVLVDTKAVSAEYDSNIIALRTQIESCKTADDFDGAKGYKSQLDDAVMQKAMKVKEVWRTLTQEQQAAAQERVFGPFFAKLPQERIRAEMLHEHYDQANFIDALNSIRKAWFAPYTPGQFVLAWASSLVGGAAPAATTATPVSVPVPTLPKVSPSPAEPKKGGNPMFTDARYRELSRLPIDELGRIMTGHGLNLSGSASKIAAGIWKHEQGNKAVVA